MTRTANNERILNPGDTFSESFELEGAKVHASFSCGPTGSHFCDIHTDDAKLIGKGYFEATMDRALAAASRCALIALSA